MSNIKQIVDKYLVDNKKIILQERLNKTIDWQFHTDVITNVYKIFTNKEYVRKRFSRLIDLSSNWKDVTMDQFHNNIDYQYTENTEKGTSKIDTETLVEIKTAEDLISHLNIDTNKWKVTNWWCKRSASGKYAVSAFLKNIEQESGINLQKAFNKFIEGYNTKILTNNPIKVKVETGRESLYLCTLSDLHIGNYQKPDYLKSIKQRIFETFNAIKNNNVEKVIILNTGDLLHTDTSKSQTWSGTQLDSQDSFEKVFSDGLDFITSLIDYAANLSLSVTFINVRGNHSFDAEYALGASLKKIYEKSKYVEIINQIDTRIYYYWKNNAFLFTHGDKGIERLPLLFATEGKEVFSKAENHHILLGHLHHSKGKQFINDRGEFAGIEVRVLGSPTSNDIWHKQNGFVQNKKSLISMIFTPEEGKYGEFNFKL